MAYIVDDTAPITSTVIKPEGKAEISVANVNPTSASKGNTITVTMDVINVGDPDTIWMVAYRKDTGARIIDWNGYLDKYGSHREIKTFIMPANDVTVIFEAFHWED